MLTPLYQNISRAQLTRRARRCSREWKAKVISIGGISVGGSGKTPIATWIARRLIEHGRKVAIVHSGYGRAASSDLLIGYHSYDEYGPAACGDEVKAMLADIPEAAFAVGKDKKRMVIAADREFAPDYVLIDDGFQRRDIAKEADIAVISEESLAETERLFPSGRMREPFTALKRADAIFLIGSSTRSSIEMKCERVFRQTDIDKSPDFWRFSFDSALVGDPPMPLTMLASRRPFVFAGIGSFGRLRDMLRAQRIILAGFQQFADHHSYSEKDYNSLNRRAAETNADCYLTTVKDLVKISHGKLSFPCYALRLIAEPAEQFSIDAIIGLV
jgi:tetraacyldisaccharide 4'-kinase